MASLKRLLNPAEEGGFRRNRFKLETRTTFDEDNITSDIPFQGDEKWLNSWVGLFNSDPSDVQLHLGPSQDEATRTAFWDAENSIQTWAVQNLPLSQSVSDTSADGTNVVGFNAGVAEQLCYGMVYRSAVKLVGDMSEVATKLNTCLQHRSAGHYSVMIKKMSSDQFLLLLDGTELGLLDTHTTEALDSVIDLPSVQVEALVDLSVLREIIYRSTKASDAKIRVNINVYGSREAREEVGRGLSARRVYLQHPDHQRKTCMYDNPHVIAFPGFQSSTQGLKLEEVAERISRDDEAGQFQRAVTNLYASLKRSSGLKRIEGDSRLKTPLLLHQQEALCFMMQRETGPVPPEFSLWRPVEVNGQHCFRHIITKAESRASPSETGGGVLADEMGMGKSLSILSLITKTLEHACAWGSDGIFDPGVEVSDKMRRSRASLVVVSSGLLVNNWLSEIDKHVDVSLKVVKYHGHKRELDAAVLADSDVVLTTYHTLAAEHAAKKSPIHDIAWYRVVLDEAHIVRRRKTTLFQTVSKLNANFRWCLTGSPIQNMLEDIGALFAFIRAYPFDSRSTFRRFIATPFDEGGARRNDASERLGLLLDSVCLRRTSDLLNLPGRVDKVRLIEFSKEEREQYEWTKNIMIQNIRQSAGEVGRKKMFGMFQAQLQLRILSNHGTFQQPFSWTDRSNIQMEQEDALCSVSESRDINCSSCRQSMPVPMFRSYSERCAHVLCSECLDEMAEESANGSRAIARCPLCDTSEPTHPAYEVGHTMLSQEENHDHYFKPQGHSSKMNALMADIQQDLWGTKSIVFSCWTRTLNLIARHLRQYSIPFKRIDGECPLSRRQKILDDFARSSDAPVLIMTTGTGAYGLNLTAANRVFIIEPQWNPSVENQAIARALRLGQGQSVLVTRYVVKSTVEMEMRAQQDRKLKIAEAGWEQP